MSEGAHLPTTVRERAVEAIQDGIPKSTVPQAYGVSRLTIDRWLERFEEDGAEGLERKPGSGRPRKLEELTEEELKKTPAFIAQQPRLQVFYLPKYSPDWNPDEKVWNHLKHQELKSHQAKTKDELKHLTRRKLQSMAKRPNLMRGLFFRCCVAELFK